MRLKVPEVRVRFQIAEIISRRTFIFARAGFGKSNLNKLLFSELYRSPPTTTKRGGAAVPVGTIVFDPDGEYFWPDDKGRPGWCDVPHLADKLVVFTSRRAPSAFYEAFTASQVKLDIRELRPADVISIALAPEKQDQQNVAKLRGLGADNWRRLVDLVHADGHNAEDEEVAALLGIKDTKQQQAELIAARSNMTTIVRMLHDPGSQMRGLLFKALEQGKLCVVDISQMRGTQGFVLAGILLRQIFSRNQEEFTKARPRTIPTVAVIEEAQSVLRERAAAAEPFVDWVKEGRKYDLGSVLVTQQPGSIPDEILSQGDNWFLFHLLSAGDLGNVKRANAHFSNDILGSLLNEPIVGQGVFWSSAKKDRAYPIPLRVLSFEEAYEARDPTYSAAAEATFARGLRRIADDVRDEAVRHGFVIRQEPGDDPGHPEEEATIPDFEALMRAKAVRAVRGDAALMRKLGGDGVPWRVLNVVIEKTLPRTVADRWNTAYQLSRVALNELFPEGWHTFYPPGEQRRWVRTGSAR